MGSGGVYTSTPTVTVTRDQAEGTTYYRWDTGTYASSELASFHVPALLGAHTLTVTIAHPKATLSTPRGPSHAHRRVTFTVYGYLRPRHTSGSHVIWLRFYRYKSGHYVYYKTIKPSVYNASYGGLASKYYVRTNLPYAGKWRVRAYHVDSGHAPTYSGYDYFRVY